MKKKISIILASVLGGISYYVYTLKDKKKVNQEIEKRSLDNNDYVVYFDDDEPNPTKNDEIFI